MNLRPLVVVLCSVLGACVDASGDGQRGASLCSVERDPLGLFCGADDGRIDSRQALALLRTELPGCEVYAMSSSGSGSLDVDGRESQWSFTVRDASDTWRSAGVYGADVEHEPIDRGCDGAPFEPLDSRAAVHEAVAELDRRIGTFTHELGNLSLEQNVCGYGELPEAHYVLFSIRDSFGVPPGTYYARFRHDHAFIDLIGPCATGSLADCLASLEPEAE